MQAKQPRTRSRMHALKRLLLLAGYKLQLLSFVIKSGERGRGRPEPAESQGERESPTRSLF